MSKLFNLAKLYWNRKNYCLSADNTQNTARKTAFILYLLPIISVLVEFNQKTYRIQWFSKSVYGSIQLSEIFLVYAAPLSLQSKILEINLAIYMCKCGILRKNHRWKPGLTGAGVVEIITGKMHKICVFSRHWCGGYGWILTERYRFSCEVSSRMRHHT